MIQVSATTFPMLGLPDWAPTLVLALLGVATAPGIDFVAEKLRASRTRRRAA